METHSFDLSVLDRLRSKRNRLFFYLRKQINFTRSGYRESSKSSEREAWLMTQSQTSQEQIRNMDLPGILSDKLSLDTWKFQLATLWNLNAFPELKTLKNMRLALELGAHDFRRAPALSQFLQAVSPQFQLIGIELDAFRVLHDLHSRADKARYFSGLAPGSRFEAADFFQYKAATQADLIFAFYPFVSPHPALAWGLPLEYGSASLWIQGIHRTLRPGGLALLMHQGKWEEEEFDEALAANPGKLKLLRRQVLECPFFPMPHPPHASLYTRASS